MCISFLFFSLRFYPLLTSDDTLNILMAFYYKLPSDFYCWGQDRGGTLIPLISQIFIKILHISPISAVSISNYLVLFLGFIGFSALFKKKSSKLIFAIAWFFPFVNFLGLLRFPLGVEYSLLGFSIFLLRSVSTKHSFFYLKNQIYLVIAIFILILSVWVSDLAIFSILLLIIIIFFFLFKEKVSRKFILYSGIYTFIGFLIGGLFIKYAKSFSDVAIQNYVSLNNLTEVGESVSIVAKNILNILLFNTKELWVGIWSWLAIVLLSWTIIISIKTPGFFRKIISNKWFLFFIADIVLVSGILFLSKWVLLNNMGVWYFVPLYITSTLSIIMIFDVLPNNGIKSQIFKIVLIATVVFGAITPIISMKFYIPKTLKPYADVKRELNVLGKSGIIGEFWNAYVSSCSNPELIIATAHDKSDVRKYELVDKVFENENIFLIKDMWLESFPDTISQFGRLLMKDGQSFKLGDCILNKYAHIKSYLKLETSDLILDNSMLIKNSESGRNILFIPYSCDSCKQKFVAKTHLLELGVGDYKLSCNLKLENFANQTETVYYVVTSDWGNNKIIELFTFPKDYIKSGYNNFEIEFATDIELHNVEIKVYYHGNCDFYFDNITLICR